MGQSGNNATKRSDLLLGRLHAGQHRAQIPGHRGPLVLGIKETETQQLGFQVLEKTE